MSRAQSPWHFLTALDGGSPDDRALLALTRDYELKVVSDMIAASRVSLLYSMSGNGKTSLVNAGVVPVFRERGYAVFRTRPRPPWCADDPALAFRMSALRDIALPLFTPAELQTLVSARGRLSAAPSAPGEDVAKLLQRVEAKLQRIVTADPGCEEFRRHMEGKLDLPIARFVEEMRLFLDTDARMLFICDQFEEMFVHFANSARLSGFAEQIGELYREPSLKTHLLFSMREDWVGSMIEFRSELPELFVHYFKLDPLRRSRGVAVLTEPLKKLGGHFEPAAAEQIVSDLAAIYTANAQSGAGAMDAVPSPVEDPFIEAPALQIVAERMWDTRGEAGVPPFTPAHYAWLARDGARGRSDGDDGSAAEGSTPAASPAQRVLDLYLSDLLNDLADSASPPDGVLTDLRIDCLYLLTDTVRHRRALSEPRLLKLLAEKRPAGLDLPAVDGKLLHAALQPLIAKGLVRSFEGAERATHFELAHDFAVRAVVRRWRELERTRTEELAILRNVEQRRRTTLAELEEAEKEGLGALLALLALALLIVLIILVRDLYGRSYYELRWLPSAGAALAAVSLPAAVLALREKRPFSFLASTVFLLLSAVEQWSMYETRDVTMTVGVALLIGVPLCLRAALELVPEFSRPPPWSRVVGVLLAELVDGWVVLAVLAGLSLIDSLSTVGPTPLFLVVVVPWMLISAGLLARTGVTLGARVAGFTIEDDEGHPPSLFRAVSRQSLLILWATAWLLVAIIGNNLTAAFVTLLLSPLLSVVMVSQSSRGGNFYDLAARTRIRHLPLTKGREGRLPWALAVIPATVVLVLFVHKEGEHWLPRTPDYSADSTAVTTDTTATVPAPVAPATTTDTTMAAPYYTVPQSTTDTAQSTRGTTGSTP